MICYLFILTLFSFDQSISYQKKVTKSFEDRLKTCTLVLTESRNQGVDSLLALSIAWQETKFTSNAVSPSGNHFGAMQVVPSLWCEHRTKKNCDLIKAGVFALRTYLEINDFDEFKAVSGYAGGGKGADDYAKKVLKTKNKIKIVLESLPNDNLIILEK